MIENNLTSRQKRFVQTLLESRSAREAAHKLGIGEKTAYRWLRLPQVQDALLEAENMILSESMHRLLGFHGAAIDELQELLNNPKLLPIEKLRVIQAIIDNSLRLRNVITIENRLSALQAIVERVKEEHSGQDNFLLD
jgi:uncharacterized small protein (DUF1192 family)